MLNIARRCVPFTPFDKDLATATVALVSATGVYAPGQEPFPTVDPGDITYRAIDGPTETSALKIAHHHYDHSEADTDPNVVFPPDAPATARGTPASCERRWRCSRATRPPAAW